MNTRQCHSRTALQLALCCLLPLARIAAQDWDIGARVASAVSAATGQKLTLTFEQRGRYEDRTGNTFGKDVDVATGLFRTRLGLDLHSRAVAEVHRHGAGLPRTLVWPRRTHHHAR